MNGGRVMPHESHGYHEMSMANVENSPGELPSLALALDVRLPCDEGAEQGALPLLC